MEREKKDILLAGVGGQGIVSIAAVIATAALKKGWNIKQSEIHGMSQRGGAVQSHLRISSDVIHSDLLSAGTTDLLLSVEPLEALRYLRFLAKDGTIVTATEPVDNIDDYPPMADVEEALLKFGNTVRVPAQRLAREAGHPKTANMVVLGAASDVTGIADSLLEEAIASVFHAKGPKITHMNIAAFRLGRSAVAEHAGLIAP